VGCGVDIVLNFTVTVDVVLNLTVTKLLKSMLHVFQ